MDFKERAKLVVEKYPLHYIIGVEKINEENIDGHKYLQRDLNDRNYLLSLAKDKL